MSSRVRARGCLPGACERTIASLLALLLFALMSGSGAATAMATPLAASPADPVMGHVEASDGQGVPLGAYANLPIARDAATSVHDTVVSICADAVWTAHLGLLGFTLGMLDWLLSFAWVEALLEPAEELGRSLDALIALPGWAPLAFTVAGLLGGIACMRGRVGAGLSDLLLSAVCFALAMSFLADPVGAIAGRSEGGAWSLRAAGQAGSELTREILTESGDALGIGDGSGSPQGTAGSVLGSRIVTRAIDHLVRGAAQEIAFGHRLSGECDGVFTVVLRDGQGPDAAREAVGRCDADAAQYLANPTMWQPMTAMLTLLGSLAILLLTGVMLVLLVLSIAWGLWSALRVALWVHVAILPGRARVRLVRALFDTAGSVLAFIVVLVLCSLGLALVLSALDRISEQGTPTVVQMGFIAVLSGVLGCGVWRVHARMRHPGRRRA